MQAMRRRTRPRHIRPRSLALAQITGCLPRRPHPHLDALFDAQTKHLSACDAQAGRESSSRRLKVFRLEAVRAGFKKAWQERDYATIIAAARKIPENVLQEDPKLLMWYDQALTRMGEE